MPIFRTSHILAATCITIGAGCAPDGDAPAGEGSIGSPRTAPSTLDPTPTATSPNTHMDDEPAPVSEQASHGDNVSLAVADLAERLGVTPEAIKVLSVEKVTWADGSAGCPEPGKNYTQALVEGQRIILEVDFVTYSYHAVMGRDAFYCPSERVQRPIIDPRI